MSIDAARAKLTRACLRRLASEYDDPHAHYDDELEYCDDMILEAAKELVAAHEKNKQETT